MIVWIDEQLSHALAPWLADRFSVEAHSVDELGFAQADDAAIFQAARAAGGV